MAMGSGGDHNEYVMNFVKSRREAGLSLAEVLGQFSINRDQCPELLSWETCTLEQVSSAIIDWIQQNREPATSSEGECAE